MRAVEAARRRALDELSGRTVWCASALPDRRASAQRLRSSLQWGGGGGLRSGVLEVAADERLRDLAQRLEAMLEGAAASQLGDAERELCAEGVFGSEEGVSAVVLTTSSSSTTPSPRCSPRRCASAARTPSGT